MKQAITYPKTTTMRLIENQRGKPVEDVIIELSKKFSGSKSKIARELGISRVNLNQWLPRLGLISQTTIVKVR